MLSPPHAGDPTGDTQRRPAAHYLVSTLACSALVAIPFLAVTIPPITDLPQLVLAELVREGQHQQHQSLLVLAVHPQDVAADALGVLGVVEQPVALGLLERGGDRLFVDGLELDHGKPLRRVGPRRLQDGQQVPGRGGSCERCAVAGGGEHDRHRAQYITTHKIKGN